MTWDSGGELGKHCANYYILDFAYKWSLGGTTVRYFISTKSTLYIHVWEGALRTV